MGQVFALGPLNDVGPSMQPRFVFRYSTRGSVTHCAVALMGVLGRLVVEISLASRRTLIEELATRPNTTDIFERYPNYNILQEEDIHIHKADGTGRTARRD